MIKKICCQSKIYFPTGTLVTNFPLCAARGLMPVQYENLNCKYFQEFQLQPRHDNCSHGFSQGRVFPHLRLKRTLPSGYTRSMMFSTVVSWMKDLLECTKNTSGTQIFFISRPSKVILLFLLLRNESLSSFQQCLRYKVIVKSFVSLKRKGDNACFSQLQQKTLQINQFMQRINFFSGHYLKDP